MKRAVRWEAIVGCYLLSMGFASAAPGMDPAPTAEPPKHEDPKSQIEHEKIGSTDPKTTTTPTLPNPHKSPRNRHRVRLADRLNRLRELMDEELALSESQHESIDQLIAGFVRESPHFQQKTGANHGKTSDLQDLRKQIYDARKAGDYARAATLRSQWVQQRYAEITQDEADLSTLLKNVEDGLTPTQRTRFQRLVDRAGLRLRAALGRNTLASLTRTLRHPVLELSGEQQAAIRRIIREEIQKIPRDDRERSGMDAAVPGIRKRAMEELSPDQRSKFEALLRGSEPTDAKKDPFPSSPSSHPDGG